MDTLFAMEAETPLDLPEKAEYKSIGPKAGMILAALAGGSVLLFAVFEFLFGYGSQGIEEAGLVGLLALAAGILIYYWRRQGAWLERQFHMRSGRFILQSIGAAIVGMVVYSAVVLAGWALVGISGLADLPIINMFYVYVVFNLVGLVPASATGLVFGYILRYLLRKNEGHGRRTMFGRKTI